MCREDSPSLDQVPQGPRYVKSQGGAHGTIPNVPVVSKICRLEGKITCGELGQRQWQQPWDLAGLALAPWPLLLLSVLKCVCVLALGLKQLLLEGRGNALWIEGDWANAKVSTEFNGTELHCWSYGGENALFTIRNTCNVCFQACLQMPWNIPFFIHSTAAWSLQVAKVVLQSLL